MAAIQLLYKRFKSIGLTIDLGSDESKFLDVESYTYKDRSEDREYEVVTSAKTIKSQAFLAWVMAELSDLFEDERHAKKWTAYMMNIVLYMWNFDFNSLFTIDFDNTDNEICLSIPFADHVSEPDNIYTILVPTRLLIPQEYDKSFELPQSYDKCPLLHFNVGINDWTYKYECQLPEHVIADQQMVFRLINEFFPADICKMIREYLGDLSEYKDDYTPIDLVVGLPELPEFICCQLLVDNHYKEVNRILKTKQLDGIEKLDGTLQFLLTNAKW